MHLHWRDNQAGHGWGTKTEREREKRSVDLAVKNKFGYKNANLLKPKLSACMSVSVCQCVLV